MTQLTPGSKLPLDQWLFRRIENAKDVPVLMDVGNDILDLKLIMSSDTLLGLLAEWEKVWVPFFRKGIVDRAEKFLYFQVRQDLRWQAAEISACLETRGESIKQSVQALSRAAQQH